MRLHISAVIAGAAAAIVFYLFLRTEPMAGPQEKPDDPAPIAAPEQNHRISTGVDGSRTARRVEGAAAVPHIPDGTVGPPSSRPAAWRTRVHMSIMSKSPQFDPELFGFPKELKLSERAASEFSQAFTRVKNEYVSLYFRYTGEMHRVMSEHYKNGMFTRAWLLPPVFRNTDLGSGDYVGQVFNYDGDIVFHTAAKDAEEPSLAVLREEAFRLLDELYITIPLLIKECGEAR